MAVLLDDIKPDSPMPKTCGFDYNCIAVKIISSYDKAVIAVPGLNGLQVKHFNEFDTTRNKRHHLFWTEDQDGEFYHIINGYGPATGRTIESLLIWKLQNHQTKMDQILYHICADYNFTFVSILHSPGGVIYWDKIKKMASKKNSKVTLTIGGKNPKYLTNEQIYDGSAETKFVLSPRKGNS